jgi:ankyrin repeat protein
MAAQPQEALKKCSSCGSLLPVTAFSRATKSRDGRAAVCRRCANVNLAAERNTSSQTVEILLGSGADINAKDHQGLTALDVAEQHGKTAVARSLRRALAKTSWA